MILQLWRVILALECILLCISSQSSIQKRQCAFQMKPGNKYTTANKEYMSAGNVSGSVQLCEHTHCCVGYFLINNKQPEVDLLACDVLEKSCPDATCKPQPRINMHIIKCVCNTDLCNSNITWTPELKEPQPTDSYTVETATSMIIFVLIVIMIYVIGKSFSQNIKNEQASSHDSHVSLLCSCQTTKTSEINIADIELQQIVANGYFATVWQGKYKGSMVAVKEIPGDHPRWKQQFATEKEVYELPLMKHAGIVDFLGFGRKLGSWLTVLQFAEQGSLHSFLCNHTANWILSLKLCQSLSQGLSYLHSDLHKHGVHKPSVAHGDLSSFNVLVKADGTCALSDFGCATILRLCPSPRSCSRNTVITPMWTNNGCNPVGTLCYMSPEILEGSVNLNSRWCLQGDMYALGLLLWEIWMRCSDLFEGRIIPQHLMPYESELGASMTRESLTLHVFHMGKRPSVPGHWEELPQGSFLEELLMECWDSDPDARLTAQCVENRLVFLQPHHSS